MTIETITATPSQAVSAILACAEIRQPVFLDGGPGIGKSDIYRHVADRLFAKEYGLTVANYSVLDADGNEVNDRPYLRDIRAALHDPVDFTGMPYLKDDHLHFAPSSMFPTSGRGLMFFDEVNRAAMMTQNALFQLILDRKAGEYVLPEGWLPMAAGNRESDGGGVMKMAQALANRFVHIHLEPDLDDWCAWAIHTRVNPIVIAFLRFRPNLLYQFSLNEHAYPTPRSWSFVNKIVGNVDDRTELNLVAGAVGHGAAVEFKAFVDMYRTLPNIDAILIAPDTAPVPTEIATLFAISSALASRAKPDNMDTIIRYLNRIPVEYAVYAIKDAALRDPMVCATSSFTTWAASHSDVI